MNESDEMKSVIESHKKAVEEKKTIIEQAVIDTRLARQVQTESPTR